VGTSKRRFFFFLNEYKILGKEKERERKKELIRLKSIGGGTVFFY
jgi:hypothetical protein